MTSDAPAVTLGAGATDVMKPEDGDTELYSVTTIIGALDKGGGLQGWAAKRTAQAAVASLATLAQRVDNEGATEVVKWLAGARFRPQLDRLTDTALGALCHDACEQYALTGVRPDLEQLHTMVRNAGPDGFEGVASEAAVLATMLDRFDEWLSRFQPAYTATEVVVYNLTYGYAGQADAFANVAGLHCLIDYKTSREPRDTKGNLKRPYPEAALQLAAYRNAEYAAVWRARRTERYRRRVYLLSDAERDQAVPVPATDAGLVVHITPEACEAFPMRTDARVFEAFLYTQEAARWAYDLAPEVVGMPLVATP